MVSSLQPCQLEMSNVFYVVGDEEFGVHDFVYVNHTSAGDQEPEAAERDHWIAKVLEIRALNPTNVYLRIYWMYWPSELPKGREYYHGDQELVASNHVDIIEAATVSAKAPVQHLIENNENSSNCRPILAFNIRLSLSKDFGWSMNPFPAPCRTKSIVRISKKAGWSINMEPRTNSTSMPGRASTRLLCGLWQKDLQLLESH